MIDIHLLIVYRQRLPRTLLQEHCQRDKRPRVIYNRAATDSSSMFRCRVILPDPKGKTEKDIMFVTQQEYESMKDAEEW
jgi:hypothetical protein